ncbi:MAG: hypothetical protein ACRD9R_05980 [Pyrinomonadaceae bacterium]
MLRELNHVTADNGLRRRWFEDDYFDLIVWCEPTGQGEIVRFQLCYDKQARERAVTWQRGEGFAHEPVDTGEVGPWDFRAPVLAGTRGRDAGDEPPPRNLRALFAERSANIDRELAEFVRRKLAEFVPRAFDG